jgi:hypothetical protein
MNYIEQINGFWGKAETAEITGNDIAVYMALLKYCNSLNWLNPFICHWEIICQYSKVSKNTYYKSLDTLSKEKFIEYKKGERNKFSAKIVILKFENNKGTVKEQQGNNRGIEREQLEEQQGNLYKPINNETNKPINNKQSVYRAFDHLVLTMEEFSEINLMYTKDEIDHILDSIENYKNNKKYKSLKMTALVWLRKEHGKRDVIQTTPSGLRPAPIQSVI